jgi:Uma2 family endonuclease
MAGDSVPLAPPPTGWTVAEVDALPDAGLRYELVDGVPRIMTPPKLKHQQARRRLANLLEQEAPADLVVAESIGLILGPDQRPIPDVAVVRGFESINGELSNFPADRIVLVAEVVSRSTRSDDRFRKPGLYAQALIGTYLRVELDPPHAVAYRLGPDGPYVELGRAEPGQQLALVDPFPVTIDPAALLA